MSRFSQSSSLWSRVSERWRTIKPLRRNVTSKSDSSAAARLKLIRFIYTEWKRMRKRFFIWYLSLPNVNNKLNSLWNHLEAILFQYKWTHRINKSHGNGCCCSKYNRSNGRDCVSLICLQIVGCIKVLPSLCLILWWFVSAIAEHITTI